MAIPSINYDTVLQIVYQWPPEQRFALIRDLLNSLEPLSTNAATLPRALGLLTTAQPAPTDEEVAAWLHEQRMEKYSACSSLSIPM